MLRATGYELSVSLVERIIPYLKKRNVLREPIRHKVSSRKYGRPGHYAVRKPQEYQAKLPAELVQLDTMDIRSLPGIVLKHFSSYDVVSRWNVLAIYHQAPAENAALFRDDIPKRTPHIIKSIQSDGGSEFQFGIRRGMPKTKEQTLRFTTPITPTERSSGKSQSYPCRGVL